MKPRRGFSAAYQTALTCVPELRRLYAFSEKNRFIDHYGVWERVWDQAKPFYEGEVGASTGIKRWNSRARELPGVAPAVIRFLLPITLFGNITDLGYELPPLHENVEQLPMTDALAEQVHRLEQDLLKQALDLVHAGDVGALAAWFAACRFRPASAFRHEQVEYLSRKGKGQIHWNLPAVISSQEPWLPKELRLAEIVRNNMSQDRKTLAFVEQSGARDIRDRFRHLPPSPDRRRCMPRRLGGRCRCISRRSPPQAKRPAFDRSPGALQGSCLQ